MAKRQKRLDIQEQFPSELSKWINYPVTIVKNDNTVIFVKIKRIAGQELLGADSRGKNVLLSADMVSEIIIDFHA